MTRIIRVGALLGGLFALALGVSGCRHQGAQCYSDGDCKEMGTCHMGACILEADVIEPSEESAPSSTSSGTTITTSISNLLVNPGFESGADSWEFSGVTQLNTDASRILSGAKSMQLVRASGYWACANQQVSNLTAGSYRLSALYINRGQNADSVLTVWDANWQPIKQINDLFATTASSAQLDVTLTSSQTSVYVSFCNSSSSASDNGVDVDDFAFGRL